MHRYVISGQGQILWATYETRPQLIQIDKIIQMTNLISVFGSQFDN